MKIEKNKRERKTQTKIVLGHHEVYYANTDLGWSIVIEPEDIIIDNYHINKSHIHYNPEKHYLKQTFPEENPQVILQIVLNHLNKNGNLDLEELKEELQLS